MKNISIKDKKFLFVAISIFYYMCVICKLGLFSFVYKWVSIKELIPVLFSGSGSVWSCTPAPRLLLG